jgi:hypothetical protein
MIKAIGKAADGRTLLTLGLSFGNLDRFRAEPLETYIRIDGKKLGIPIDVIIFSGETEEQMQGMMMQFVGPETKIHNT